MSLLKAISARNILQQSTFRHLHSVSIATMSNNPLLEFVDIGVNLTDEMYKGKYHGKKAHQRGLLLSSGKV